MPPVVRSAGPFAGAADEGALWSALLAVAARHAALRTTLDGTTRPGRRVHEGPSVELAVAAAGWPGDPVLALWVALRSVPPSRGRGRRRAQMPSASLRASCSASSGWNTGSWVGGHSGVWNSLRSST